MTKPAAPAATAESSAWSWGFMWAGLLCFGLAAFLATTLWMLLRGNGKAVHYVKIVLPSFFTKNK